MGVFDLLMGALDSIAQPEGPMIDPAVETSASSITLYERGDFGALEQVQQITPTLFSATHGIAVHLVGPASYYLDQVRAWPAGGEVCVYHHLDAARCRYVRVDEVHHAVSAALALRQAIA